MNRTGLVRICDQVLWVDLVFLKHHKDGRVALVVHTTVVEDGIATVFGRGAEEAGVPSGVVPHQHTAHKHGPDCRLAGVAVGVLGIPGKVAS